MSKKDKPKATKILNGRVTEDIYKAYEAQAKKERRKVGQLVTIVLEDATNTFNYRIAK